MITSAAVKIQDLRQNKEIIISCHRHCDAFYILKEFGYKLNIDYKILSQGFLNQNKEFLSRFQAYDEAKKCGQIVETRFDNTLYSEDLW